jgi:hypothetical protein
MCTATASELLIAGGVIQGVGTLAASGVQATTLEAKAQIAESNARLKDIQADEVKQQGETEAVQTRVAVSREVSQQVSSTVGAGLDVGGATAQEVVLSSELAGVADILTLKRNTRKRAWSLSQEAKNLRFAARQAKKAAKVTRLLAPVTAAAPIIQGFGQAKLAAKQTTKKKKAGEI